MVWTFLNFLALTNKKIFLEAKNWYFLLKFAHKTASWSRFYYLHHKYSVKSMIVCRVLMYTVSVLSCDSSSVIIFCSGGLPTFCMVRVVKLRQKLWQRCSIKDSSHSPTSFAWQTSLWCFGTEKSLLGSKMFTHR